jgi:hypothetical protein
LRFIFIFGIIIKMQSILKRRTSPGVANPMFQQKTPSPRTTPRIRIKNIVSIKKNKEVEGKLGRFLGKTANNMFILEVEGKTYNFFRKDLDISEEPTKPKSPIRVSPFRMSPGSSEAERIADGFISGLDSSIAEKVISAICKRRTSKPRKSPTRVSPTKRKSPKRTCKSDEEIAPWNGRCVKTCRDDQERDLVTHRCKKRTSGKKASPTVRSPKVRRVKTPSPPKPSIVVDDDDLIVEGSTPVRKSPKRVFPPKEFERPKRPIPKFVQTDEIIPDEEEDFVTQFVTEEVPEGPFVDETQEVGDGDLLVEY